MKKHSSLSKAFSLVELSVVIIIIGILIAGVTQGTRIIDEARLRTSRDLTTNSRINSLEGLVLWYETSLVSSFSKSDAVDGVVVSQWNDINPQSNMKLHAKAGQRTDSSKNTYNPVPSGTSGNTSGPTYIEDGINHIPTLRFTNNATSAYRYLSVDGNMTSNPNDSMTLFFVINYRSGGGSFIDRNCPIAGPSCAASPSYGIFTLFAAGDGTIVFGLRSDSAAPFPIIGASMSASSGYAMQYGKPTIITFQRDYGNAFVIYANGSSSYNSNMTKADNGDSLTALPFKIGRHSHSDGDNVDMDISEFIFVSSAIKKRDRYEIENYLGKKYNIPVMH